LIPISQAYPYLQHIIVAVSAVHYYHAIKQSSHHSPSIVRQALIDALHSRQEAIQALMVVLQRPRGDTAKEQSEQDALLATVLFFVNFSLIDSGKDGWKDHLTAAGRLLATQWLAPTAQTSATDDRPSSGPNLKFDDVPLAISGAISPSTFDLATKPETQMLRACRTILGE
jgi:hypothetical protein